MNSMFYDCSSIKELLINKFIINNDSDVNLMLCKSSEELQRKILAKNKNINNKVFDIRYW